MTDCHCPLCGHNAPAFFPFGNPPRPNAKCPRCGALERHRFIWAFLTARKLLRSGMVVVHFAPRQCLANAIHAVVGAGYATADKEPGGADQVLDLTALAMPDKSVDGLIASHVLEHIEDDAQALREIRRMLRPGGWALLIVPQRLGRPTFEDPVAAASGAAARNEAFGHPDHVRWYGGDFADRIAGAGLEVEAFDPVGCLGDAKATRQALGTDTIHLCQRGK